MYNSEKVEKKIKFKSTGSNEFAKTLKYRVHSYFKDNNISIYANGLMLTKTIVQLTLWIGAYVALIVGDGALVIQYFLWGFLGIMIALVTINIGHDAIH